MIKEIVIEWNFEPKEYFEDKITIEGEGFELVIDSGLAEVRLGPESFENVDRLISIINEDLESRFMAVQVMTHERYKLSKPSRYDLRIDGGKNHYLQVDDSLVCVASMGKVDLIVRDPDGNIVSNTKQDRVNKKKKLADLAARFRGNDPTLDQMLRSYSASVSDPKNELVHLYEIRDAAAKRFKNDSKAKATLGITKDEWNMLGRLANNEPFTQGRHRGQNPGVLRDANINELEQARKIAAIILESYMNYLEAAIERDCTP
ncbi:hypothetical protein KOM00_05980 [Geomonas sp. Red69]|uniref:hypothetical protein n=1 Tax=Geomonas diazotrophica TaxID=2843197 RepID=UPI001C1153B3|nr:hypothetical protein [Geomonas diazotrophica]MBU5636278.1 hypothetical protein [Geomonas diazotrophica]